MPNIASLLSFRRVKALVINSDHFHLPALSSDRISPAGQRSSTVPHLDRVAFQAIYPPDAL